MNYLYCCWRNLAVVAGKYVAAVVACLLLMGSLLGQNSDTIPSLPQDSLSPLKKAKWKLDSFARKQQTKSIEKYNYERFARHQEEIISQMKATSAEARDYLKNGIDTIPIIQSLNQLDSLYIISQDGIFTYAGTSQTHRNLTTTSIILRELLVKALKRKKIVDDYRQKLYNYKFLLDSLGTDSALYQIPSDSVSLMNMLARYSNAAIEMGTMDTALDGAVSRVHSLQRRVNLIVKNLEKSIESVEIFRNQLHDNAFKREYGNIWGEVGFRRPISEIIHSSFIKGSLALKFYANNNLGKIILCILLIAALGFFLRSIKRELKREELLSNNLEGQLVFRYPIYSSIFIGVNLLQFIFPGTPFVFSVIFWMIAAYCLTVIFSGYISKSWMRLWLCMGLLFLLACFDNTILQASRVERWGMLLLSVSGILVGAYFLIKGNRDQLKEKTIIYFIGFVVLLEFLATIANMFGRYNFAKTLLTSGFINLIIAIMFLWTARLINEILAVASKV